MQFPAPVSLTWIAELIQAKLVGNTQAQATGINEIHKVEKGDLVFVDHPKYYNKCLNSAASFIIINKETEVPEGKALLIVENPFEAYCRIVQHFRPFEPATKLISDSARIGEGSFLYPGVFVGHHVRIGKNCIIHPNVTIMDHCIIGNNVIVQAGTVIGSDAFYYNSKKDRELWYKKMPSCGRVIIEDDVEIGAGCTIDRGVSHDSIIGRGTKMDNMIHIGHDTVTGKNCLIAAQVGIAGVVTLEDGVTLWGQVGVSKTLTIGANATIYAQSGVGKDTEGGKVYFGSPIEDAKEKMKELVWVKRIPELWEKVMGK
ncbi:MAG TPA: UDP-3-O-(3-hydroxymyristoyl)glucosamine N-acyltransferase [Ferruginibacter sp.]|nr:UDP-3-O-(3-hydroxymyristoyl)glucosamine N-acyltransferase [Ferruginibacter sp.]HNA00227.1 UDP-3-O-(3-hydroxymyristoyl)glucosamine N-acyltransferase [Ferruginibacter sp.]HNJ93948.1 UDP-3-O-(3-hydroxymyristoyl)glucosamine N-acyltransferase [Ferruginibacter sp.]HNK27353.1 UDP-3-O-(3-hydroxymyristoyl)glucosamine N-acyltransferase [Ferruginibacter sp.]HNN71423.1 UDP-3-O-(3-hydroxymyristoyl)glucosamine N-acyltransferase [Ferruginibacter sp.]